MSDPGSYLQVLHRARLIMVSTPSDGQSTGRLPWSSSTALWEGVGLPYGRGGCGRGPCSVCSTNLTVPQCLTSWYFWRFSKLLHLTTIKLTYLRSFPPRFSLSAAGLLKPPFFDGVYGGSLKWFFLCNCNPCLCSPMWMSSNRMKDLCIRRC